MESIIYNVTAYEMEDDDNDDQELLRHSWMDDASNSELCKGNYVNDKWLSNCHQ